MNLAALLTSDTTADAEKRPALSSPIKDAVVFHFEVKKTLEHTYLLILRRRRLPNTTR